MHAHFRPFPWQNVVVAGFLFLAACGASQRQDSGTKDLVWPTLTGAPGSGLMTIEMPPLRNQTAPGAVLTDIVSHLPDEFGNMYYDSDLVTWGHETSHGLSSHVRNTENNTGRKANGFYVTGNRAVVVVEPKIKKSQIADFVPASLRGSRFALYILGRAAWDDTPLYVMDEHNAYINGAKVGVDLYQKGLWTQGNRDAVEGALEFSVYALALGRAVQAHDPEYFRTYPQFSEFLAFQLESAMKVFRAGAVLPPFARESQTQTFETLRSAREARRLRDFATALFGEAWTNEVLLKPLDGATAASPEEPALASDDADGDGVADEIDQCDRTPSGQVVWTYGEWSGCADGQSKDLI